MSERIYLVCPNCGREYRTEQELQALWVQSGFCITSGCGCDLSQPGDDEEVWMDWFGDGTINGKF